MLRCRTWLNWRRTTRIVTLHIEANEEDWEQGVYLVFWFPSESTSSIHHTMDDRTLHNELLRMQRNMSHSAAEYVNVTRRMMYMVKAVDLTLESLYTGRALDRAIWRYEALWLPLLAAVSNPPTQDAQPKWTQSSFTTKVDEIQTKNFSKGGLWLDPNSIIPPIDIAWVWHCHRLNPIGYEADLASFVPGGDDESFQYFRKACSTTVDTAFRFSDGEDAQSKPTRRLWDIIYPFESFMPKYLLSHSFAVEESKKRQHITSFTNEITRDSFRSVLKYDLMTAACLQKAFLYQIVDEDDIDLGVRFETNEYLHRAYHRYLQFIVLHRHAPDALLVPMNDINIIWHMHLSCTVEYNHDCNVLIGYVVKHDHISVERMREEALAQMDADRIASGEQEVDPETLDEDEYVAYQERKRRGIAIRETKALWESVYGATPRYDLPDTRYRGQPTGDRGGFYEVFQKINGTTKDITWPETVLRMVLAIFVCCGGAFLMCWAFYKTMVAHGKFLVGLPVGVGVMALGLYIFLAIPISRPLSSQSRFWLERAYRQTHNPLPPYLMSSQKKVL